jgi:hypothetical protein
VLIRFGDASFYTGKTIPFSFSFLLARKGITDSLTGRFYGFSFFAARQLRCKRLVENELCLVNHK